MTRLTVGILSVSKVIKCTFVAEALILEAAFNDL